MRYNHNCVYAVDEQARKGQVSHTGIMFSGRLTSWLHTHLL